MNTDDHAGGEGGHPIITDDHSITGEREGVAVKKISLLDNTYPNVRKQWIFYTIMMKRDYNELV